MDDRIHLLDIPIDNLTRVEVMRRVGEYLRGDRLHHVVTVGPEFLLESTANPAFAAVLQHADMALPEGMGVTVGARLTGQRVRQRYPGADFVDDLLQFAARHGHTVFLYGARPAVVEKAVLHMLSRFRGLKIVGYESGYRTDWNQLEDRRIIEKIHLAKPDILLVAKGSPKQDLWIEKHQHALHRVRLAVGVGRTFEYYAGTIRRPPFILRRLGLEWVHTWLRASRFHEPSYRRQRVVNATWHFLLKVRRHAH